jgi:plasmid stabilization system protein ParE
LKLELERAAFEELIDAVERYERDYPGRGVRFRIAVERALARISSSPDAFAERLGVRATQVSRFPYVIFYVVVDESTVRVRAVAHARRRPRYWRRRR